MIPEHKINALIKEFELLNQTVSDPAIVSDTQKYKTVMRRYRELSDLLEEWNSLNKQRIHLDELKKMLDGEGDPDMADMIREELDLLSLSTSASEQRLIEMLSPKDPNDHKNAIVEIRAGTGGEEAALFVQSLFRMYSYYAEKKGWKQKILDSNATELGGFKEIIFLLEGEDVFGSMRYESGVHRVQRIPQTEASGRIHTSAVSVAVLPEADEIDIEISENDLRIDVYRSSGHGGQSVNTTDSAVRITHVPTGLVVTCQDEKSQIKNKAKAMGVLRSRLLDAEIMKQEQEIARDRRAQVSTGDRSAKIRTYNFPQSRVTDHRINLTTYNLDGFMSGEIEEFIKALQLASRNEKVNE